MAATDISTGASIAHGTTSFSIEILSMSGSIERAAVDSTHLGTTGARTKVLGDLYDPGSITLRANLNSDEEAPYTSAAETVTVTFPIPSGGASGATVAGSGGVTNFSWDVGEADTVMTCTYTVTFLDDLTWTNSA